MINVFEFKMQLWYEFAKQASAAGCSTEQSIDVANKIADAFEAKFVTTEETE